MNFGDIIIGALIVAALLAAIMFMRKKEGCGGEACESCAFSESCEKKENTKR